MNETTQNWELVNPGIAEKWLKTSLGNRKERDVEKYAEDMRSENWHSSNPQPIIFDKDGRLRDGHNRLKAVISSGKTVNFLIVRNVDPACIKTLDSGRSRTDVDALRLEAIDKSMNVDFADAGTLAVVKRLLVGLKSQSRKEGFSRSVLWDGWLKHYKEINYAFSNMPRIYTSAPIIAAIAKAAFSGVSPVLLDEFKSPFINQLDVCSDEKLQPAFKLKALIDAKTLKTQSSGNAWEFFSVAIESIRRFVEGEQMPKKTLVKGDPFPEPTLDITEERNKLLTNLSILGRC